MKNTNKSVGFTLIEVIIAIAITAILLAIAIPSFMGIIQNNRSVSYSSDFVRSVQYARDEAIKRSTTVSICAASSTALTACGSSSNWTNGWLIFEDVNNNGVYNSATDTLLGTYQNLSVTGTFSAPASRMIYNASGFLNSGSGVYTLSATGCSGNNARSVNIANNGRISVSATACP